MLARNAKVDLIRGVPLFAGCSRRELAEIAGIADELHLPADRKLTVEGASGKEFIVIVDGAAEVRRGGRRINTLESGDFLGEIALLTARPRTATVTTTTPTRILVVSAPAFRALLRRMPTLSVKVLEALAARLPE